MEGGEGHERGILAGFIRALCLVSSSATRFAVQLC